MQATHGKCHVAHVFRFSRVLVYFAPLLCHVIVLQVSVMRVFSKITGYSQSNSLPTSLFLFCIVNVSFCCAAVRFYEGIVELALHEANKRDAQGLALHFYGNGEPHADIQGEEAFIAR